MRWLQRAEPREFRRAKKPAIVANVYERMARTVLFNSRLPTILAFPELAILRYESLKRAKVRIGKTDLRIAAIALEMNAIVTCNVRDFGEIPGLTMEDWSK